MEVYSDRISIDQDEQERLRFSPDDIVKLPIHRAINLWVADGAPRAGFLAHTLPMEPLHDDELADAPPRRAARARRPPPRATSPTRSPTTQHADRSRATPRRPAQRRARTRRDATPTAASRPARDEPLQLPLDERSTTAEGSMASDRCCRASYIDAHRYDGAAIQHDRRDRLVPCAVQPRDVAIVARRLALQVPHRTAAARAVVARRAPPGRPTAASASSSDAGHLERFRPDRPPRLVPLDLPPRRTTATACSSTPALIDRRRSATARARSTTTATSSTRSSSTPGSSPTAAPLGAALLAWDGETDIEPPPEARKPAAAPRRRLVSRGPRDDPRARLVRPDAMLEIARRRPAASRDRSSSSTTAPGASTRTTTSSAATTPSCAGGGATPRYADHDDAAVRALRLPRRTTSATQFLARRRPRTHRPPLAPQRPTRAPRVRRPATDPVRDRARRPRRRPRGLAAPRLPARPSRAPPGGTASGDRATPPRDRPGNPRPPGPWRRARAPALTTPNPTQGGIDRRRLTA